MPLPPTQSPVMADVFRCSRAARVAYGVGLASALVLAAAILLLRPPVLGRWYLEAAVAAAVVAGGMACWLALVRARDVYVLFDEGLVRRTPGVGQRAARWEEVAAVRERRVLRRLELENARGELLLTVAFDVADFARLERLVLERTRSFQAPEVSPPAARGAAVMEP